MDDNEAFKFIVKTDSIYLPTITIQAPLTPALTGISPSTGSIGGEKLILSTIGLGLSVNTNYNVFYTSGGSTINIWDTITVVDITICFLSRSI